jgi:hypothetical protein
MQFGDSNAKNSVAPVAMGVTMKLLVVRKVDLGPASRQFWTCIDLCLPALYGMDIIAAECTLHPLRGTPSQNIGKRP